MTYTQFDRPTNLCFCYLAGSISKATSERGHIRGHSLDLKSSPSQQDDSCDKSQVVAVGTALPTLNLPSSAAQAQVVVRIVRHVIYRAMKLYVFCRCNIVSYNRCRLLASVSYVGWCVKHFYLAQVTKISPRGV